MAKQPLPLPGALESPAQDGGAFSTIFYKFLASVRDALIDIGSTTDTHETLLSNGSGPADPTASDIADGRSRIWTNTSTNTTRLWSNVGGTLKSVTLT